MAVSVYHGGRERILYRQVLSFRSARVRFSAYRGVFALEAGSGRALESTYGLIAHLLYSRGSGRDKKNTARETERRFG